MQTNLNGGSQDPLLNHTLLLNASISQAYEYAQNAPTKPREVDVDWLHVSSLVNNPCQRKLAYQYFNKDVPVQTSWESSYRNSIFAVGVALEQDRIGTIIKQAKGKGVHFAGTWRCKCGIENPSKGISFLGIDSLYDNRHAQVCPKCNTTARNYDEWQFKVDRIGISGRPDLVMVTKSETGEWMLNIYELKTVMKDDFVSIVNNRTFKDLAHIKQSCVYYYFFLDLIKQTGGIDFLDDEGKPQKVKKVNPFITVWYVDKRDNRVSLDACGSEQTYEAFKKDWMMGCSNYLYVYKVGDIEIPDKKIKNNQGYINNFTDKMQLNYPSDDAYLKVGGINTYIFSCKNYVKFLSNVSTKVREHKKNDTLPDFKEDKSDCPCWGRSKTGEVGILKSKATGMENNCPYWQLCKADKKRFFEQEAETVDK